MPDDLGSLNPEVWSRLALAESKHLSEEEREKFDVLCQAGDHEWHYIHPENDLVRACTHCGQVEESNLDKWYLVLEPERKGAIPPMPRYPDAITYRDIERPTPSLRHPSLWARLWGMLGA
jgi:hypothetical protein